MKRGILVVSVVDASLLEAHEDCVDVECGLDAVERFGVEALELESVGAGFVVSGGLDAMDASIDSGDRVRVGIVYPDDVTKSLR